MTFKKLVQTKIYTLFILLSLSSYSFSQPLKNYNSSEIELALKKLNVLGTVLYVAAHPDDENTRLLTYFANEKMLRTAYLSMTRGDGGQNLIGSELRDLLGLIRTQELLQARRTDGAEQYFTRANDFGYSKNPEETMKIWDHDKALADVVWTIRKLQPDIIITRFPRNGDGGHGHHTASAILAEEGFTAAADPAKFPEQLKFVKPWQARRIFWNAWRIEKGLKINVGTYNPLLGKSYTEIAADSRTMHKSQGFGVPKSRGNNYDFLQQWAGDSASTEPFEGIDLSWNRIKGGDKYGKMITEIIKKYDNSDPGKILPDLTNLYKILKERKGEFWVDQKLTELTNLILSCGGIYYEVTASDFAASPGDSVRLNFQVLNRSDFNVSLEKVNVLNVRDTVLNKSLKNNEETAFPMRLVLPSDFEYSNPYWLKEAPSKGSYTVNDQQLIGLPEIAGVFKAEFTLVLDGKEKITLTTPVYHKWTDPVKGEKYRSFEVTPEVILEIPGSVFIFNQAAGKEVSIKVRATGKNRKGEVKLDLPSGWKSEPLSVPFELAKKGDEKVVKFKIIPGNQAGTFNGKIVANVNGKSISKFQKTIDYDHIPTQTLFPEASLKLVRSDIKTAGNLIGYIAGAGDEIPWILKEIGFQVVELNEQQLNDVNELVKFDAIVVGVRAYNTDNRLKSAQKNLMEYVNSGGNFVVQYNTNFRLVTENIGPYPFSLSRERVTVEEAPVRILKDQHSLLNYPNKITENDFEGWVQERGLYFPDKYDPAYETVISSNDPGEKAGDGGILYTRFGKGVFTYSSYSWFRQLPEGVPGAVRLFTNLVSAGKIIKDDQKQVPVK